MPSYAGDGISEADAGDTAMHLYSLKYAVSRG